MPVDAKWLVIVTGVVSTAVSLGGGLVMYFESVRILEDATKDSGMNEVDDITARVEDTVRLTHEAMDALEIALGALSNSTLVGSEQDLYDYLRFYALSGIRTGLLSGLGIVGPNTYRLLWTEPTGWGKPNYVYGTKGEVMEGCKEPCIHVYNLTDHAQVDRYQYRFGSGLTRYIKKQHTAHGFAEGHGWWDGPFTWVLADGGVDYVVNAHMRMQPLGHALFQDDLYAWTEVNLVTWQKLLSSVQVSERVSVLILQTAKGNPIFAFRDMEFNDPVPCDETTATSFLLCGRLTVNEIQNSAQQAAVRAVNASTDGIMNSNGYWVAKRLISGISRDRYHVFDFNEHMGHLSVVWLRKEDLSEIKDALVLFLVFVVVILVFDVLNGIAEIFLVARPLSQLAAVTHFIENLELCDARTALATGRVMLVIGEVVRLHRGLSFAVEMLDEYKSYLPRSLFLDQNSDDEDTSQGVKKPHSKASVAPSTKASDQSSSTATTRSRKVVGPGGAHVTSLGLSTAEVGILKLVFVGIQKEVARLCCGTEGRESFDVGVFQRRYTEAIEKVVELTTGRMVVSPLAVGDCASCTVTTVGGVVLLRASRMAVSLAESLSEVAVGVHGGRWCHGNLGCTSYRAYAVLQGEHPVLRACVAGAVECCKIAGSNVLVAKQAFTTISSQFRLVPVLACKGAVATTLYQIAGTNDKQDQEWMYSLQDSSEDGELTNLVIESERSGKISTTNVVLAEGRGTRLERALLDRIARGTIHSLCLTCTFDTFKEPLSPSQ